MKLTSEIQSLYKEGQVSIKKTLSNWEYYKYEILLAFKIRKMVNLNLWNLICQFLIVKIIV